MIFIILNYAELAKVCLIGNNNICMDSDILYNLSVAFKNREWNSCISIKINSYTSSLSTSNSVRSKNS